MPQLWRGVSMIVISTSRGAIPIAFISANRFLINARFVSIERPSKQ